MSEEQFMATFTRLASTLTAKYFPSQSLTDAFYIDGRLFGKREIMPLQSEEKKANQGGMGDRRNDRGGDRRNDRGGDRGGDRKPGGNRNFKSKR